MTTVPDPPESLPDAVTQTALAAPGRGGGVTWRSVGLSLVLLPVNAFWVVQMEMVRYSAHPTTIALFFNAIFILLCLSIANHGVGTLRPLWALRRSELLLIYSVLCLGSCVCGHDLLQVFVPFLTWSFRHATDTNQWDTLFNPHLRRGLFVGQESIYRGFYNGNDTIWRLAYLRVWLPVVTAWTLFFTVLLAVMLCINAILRKQWTENERLTYPLAQLPLQISSEQAFQTDGLFRNRLFWIGFIVAGSIDMVNSLNYYYPFLPTVLTPGFGQSFIDIGPYFTTKPWSAVGWTPVSFYPFLIGLGMFMPLDFLFSCFFFYWFWKLEHVAAVAMAYDSDPRVPYAENQAFGAYLSFCLYAAWISRQYLGQVVRKALGLTSTLDDSREPMRYRTALLGALGGIAFLTAFASYLGMKWWIGIAFFVLYFALAIAITRMRAELGTPIHDLHYTGPEQTLVRVAGSRAFNTETLTVFAVFYGFNRAYRGHPMPHQLESYKFAEQTASDYRRWNAALLALGGVAVFVGFWTILALMYHYGVHGKSHAQIDSESFDYLTSQIQSPQHGKFGELLAIFVGVGVAFGLQWLRVKLPWWPLHPLAYAVTSSWEINLVWLPLCLAWIIKGVLLRFGGRSLFHRSLPFFFGVILGQFVVGSLWNLYGIANEIPTYQFWQ
jgi:hypothetical protein